MGRCGSLLYWTVLDYESECFRGCGDVFMRRDVDHENQKMPAQSLGTLKGHLKESSVAVKLDKTDRPLHELFLKL